MCERLVADGVASVLATICTAPMDVMTQRIRQVVEFCKRDELARSVVAGLHLEGPFISRIDGYRRAHPLDAVRPATPDDAARLLEAGEGLVKLVTLAPECDDGCRRPPRWPARASWCPPGIPTRRSTELKASAEAGLSMFTHLGNGSPPACDRHDNIIQRALSLHDRLWLCFIGDGVHVPLMALGNYMRAADAERTIVVTDAVVAAGLGQGTFHFANRTYQIGPDMAARLPGTPYLMGSVATMNLCADNLAKMGYSRREILTFMRDNPRKAFGL